MKRIFSLIPGTIYEFFGIALLIAMYWWTIQWGAPPIGKELHLLEAAREALNNQKFYYPTYNESLYIPVAPLLTVLISLLFKFLSIKLLLIRGVMLMISISALFAFYSLGVRVFHASVGVLGAGFILATWGFFSNSSAVNGAMLYFLLVVLAFLLFYHWFDSAFRSRTYARSLYPCFILLGILFGLAFCAQGIPGVLFPVVVMLITLAVSGKLALLKDVHYSWMLLPFAGIVLLWSVLGAISIGFVPFILVLSRINPAFLYLGEPILYLIPIIPLLLPSLFAKDIWGRAVLTYNRGLLLLITWFFAALIFLFLFSEMHEAFSLLIIAPALLWMAFYLSEIFRNPLIPRSLQLVVDGLILSGLFLSVCLIIITFQIVPPSLSPLFVLFSSLLPLISLALLFLRDSSISRALPVYIIPSALVLCILAKMTIEPLIRFKPDQELYRLFPAYELQHSDTAIIEWISDEQSPSVIRFITPLSNRVMAVNDPIAMESLIQTRQGLLYLVIPEAQFYNLPFSVREMGSIVKTSWRWKEPLTIPLVVRALLDETLDFEALSEPVFLFKIPTTPDI